MVSRRIAGMGAASIGLFLLVGCGPGGKARPAVYPVSGKVTFKGQPVADAEITYQNPDSPRVAYGHTDAEGEYQLSTFGTNDGAVEGEHVVTIAKVQKNASAPAMDASQPGEDYDKMMTAAAEGTMEIEHQLPAKYANPETSGLKRKVIPGDVNTFDFDLTE